jgi:Raf kinase inhibitor-like YbhB/YbcL family protein
MRLTNLRFGAAVLTIWLASAFGPVASCAADHPDLFRLTSPDFEDNAMLTPANLGTGSSPRGNWDCGGRNVSPALTWSQAPEGTKSFAVIMDDPDAASGLGANHWIAYDIPANVDAVPRDAGNGRSALLVPGVNGRKLAIYSGPCPEPGAKPHHFLWLVFALDLAPGTLKPGLSREQFMQQIQGHNLAEASLSSRYQR